MGFHIQNERGFLSGTMKTNKFLHYLNNSFLVIAALIFAALAISWHAVSAQAQDEENQGNENSSSNVLFSFEETAEMLILNVDASAEGANASLMLNEDGQVVWQYVGPSSTGELSGCNELGWQSLMDKANDAQATPLSGEGDAPKKASLSLKLRTDATSETGYCFTVPIVIGDVPTDFYKAYTLENAPAPADDTLIFRPAAPASASEVPASVSVSVSEGTSIKPDSWKYARVENDADCDEGNETLSFESLDSSTGDVVLELSAEDAGSVFCFQVTLAGTDSQEGETLYQVYPVPGVADPIDEDEAGGVSWIFIAAIVIVIGIVIYIVIRSSRSKE